MVRSHFLSIPSSLKCVVSNPYNLLATCLFDELGVNFFLADVIRSIGRSGSQLMPAQQFEMRPTSIEYCVNTFPRGEKSKGRRDLPVAVHSAQPSSCRKSCFPAKSGTHEGKSGVCGDHSVLSNEVEGTALLDCTFGSLNISLGGRKVIFNI
jgi:hypothetical protein